VPEEEGGGGRGEGFKMAEVTAGSKSEVDMDAK
jgi:hypothetical protein